MGSVYFEGKDDDAKKSKRDDPGRLQHQTNAPSPGLINDMFAYTFASIIWKATKH